MKSDDSPNGFTSNCMAINGEGLPIVMMLLIMTSLIMMSLIQSPVSSFASGVETIIVSCDS